MIARLTSAFGTMIGAFLVLTIALAVLEGFGGYFIDPFQSRKALFLAVLALSVAAGVARWFMTRDRAAVSGSGPEKSAGAEGTRTPASPAPAASPAASTSSPGTSGAAKDDPRKKDGARSGSGLIEKAARQAIVFRQHFPPPHDPDIRSFFGGTPVAPRGFEWPRFGANKPLHFLLQVDCAAIPDEARLGALPASGVLYFFLDLDWGGPVHARVIHADGIGWKSVPPPNDLGPAYGKQAPHMWGWAQSIEHCPVLLPKWPVEPVVLKLPEPVVEEEGEPAQWPGGVDAELVRAQGARVSSTPITVKDVVDGNSLRRPFEAFPHDWRALQICSAKLVEEADRTRRYPRKSIFPDLDDAAKAARLEEISIDAQAWFDIAVSKPAFDEVPRADRNAFWEFLAEHAPLTRFVLPDALSLAIECSLSESAEAAARVPAELAARVLSLHALAVTTDRGVHTNIPDRMLAPPVDIQGNNEDRMKTHLLLLELSSEEGIGHHFGEGVYQFWITPADLLEGRFDKVEVTADAY